MYAITGITGKVGGAVARTLLAADQSVRAVVRDAGKGRSWAEEGCEVALAEMEDAGGTRRRFQGSRRRFHTATFRIRSRTRIPRGSCRHHCS